MTLYIKNMVCGRCLRVVRETLEGLGLTVQRVSLGEADIPGLPPGVTLMAIREALVANEFDLLDDQRAMLLEQLKTLIIDQIHHHPNERPAHQNLSDFLSERVGYDYSYLSHLFSSAEGMTLERFVIAHRIERAKELLRYGELSISEIAWQLGYSSVQHLSNQFRQVTAQTPRQFQQTSQAARQELDKVAQK